MCDVCNKAGKGTGHLSLWRPCAADEINLLKEYICTEKSELIAVYGRRRVGKTFLVKQVIGDQACFSLTGMENADMGDQLANFYFSFINSL